ncbi:Uncharacterised protein [Dermatophilus congolensis]|uniref:Uncharacterized protein n=1 Tax=Dermatophilus congolensis TaxID=1863 RepID=A0AA46H0V4_9MICO|nr:hypothetical protein [Dermatophilus congolensis]STD11391.1 Uncharacterised protein [Dermatophilus congolensis]
MENSAPPCRVVSDQLLLLVDEVDDAAEGLAELEEEELELLVELLEELLDEVFAEVERESFL